MNSPVLCKQCFAGSSYDLPRTLGVQVYIPALGPGVCRYYLHWAIWIPGGLGVCQLRSEESNMIRMVCGGCSQVLGGRDRWEYTSLKGDPNQIGNLLSGHFWDRFLNNYHVNVAVSPLRDGGAKENPRFERSEIATVLFAHAVRAPWILCTDSCSGYHKNLCDFANTFNSSVRLKECHTSCRMFQLQARILLMFCKRIGPYLEKRRLCT